MIWQARDYEISCFTSLTWDSLGKVYNFEQICHMVSSREPFSAVPILHNIAGDLKLYCPRNISKLGSLPRSLVSHSCFSQLHCSWFKRNTASKWAPRDKFSRLFYHPTKMSTSSNRLKNVQNNKTIIPFVLLGYEIRITNSSPFALASGTVCPVPQLWFRSIRLPIS